MIQKVLFNYLEQSIRIVGSQMIFDEIIVRFNEDTIIPKPEAKGAFKIKGLGKRRKEKALIYYIPNHNNPEKPYQKGITASEFEIAYQQLLNNGELSRSWFNKNLSQCAEEGTCNFTTVGGIFELLDLAVYNPGKYVKK
jgi:hypothetical protein